MPGPARFLVIALAAFGLVASCADQAEGERCDAANGNADCESGLVCTPVSRLAIKETAPSGAAVCCPPEGQVPNADACLRAVTVPTDGGSTGGSTGTPPDAGSTGGSSGADAQGGG